MGSRELPAWLNCIESNAAVSDTIIVPGGGVFADKVREQQTLFKFDDAIAHQMALLAMCQFGYLLTGISRKLQIVEDVESISTNLGKKLPLLWLPKCLIEDDFEIPASWDYTSDSIALWLAIQVKAQRLVLVKSKELNNDSCFIENHIENGDLDKGFQELNNKFNGEIIFFNKTDQQKMSELFV